MNSTEAYDSSDEQAAASTEALMFSLLHAAQGLQGRMERAFEEVGLSSAKYFVLATLYEEGASLPLSELAARLKCVRSNMTQLVDRLEKDGYVRRVHDTEDRRVIRAELTENGAERAVVGAKKMASVEMVFAASLAGMDRRALASALSVLE